MARPREFDEMAALDAATDCFWSRGFEATTVRDLMDGTGLSGASLYNAFGDKRALFGRALDHYVERSIAARLRRCQALPPRGAISMFFEDLLERSLSDSDRKGCFLVNTALDRAPHDPQVAAAVAEVLGRIEAFFRDAVAAGQRDGTIAAAIPADVMARSLLAQLLGLRVLARVRPERFLLRDVVAGVEALLGDRRPPEPAGMM